MLYQPRQHDESGEDAACKKLFAGILKRAVQDLHALVDADDLPSGKLSNVKLGLPERQEMYGNLTGWFFIPDAENSETSLDAVCRVLNLDVDQIRERAWAIVTKGFRIPKIRRRRLSTEVRAAILTGLSHGRGAREIAEQFGVNPATCRKIRCKARREAGEVAAA